MFQYDWILLLLDMIVTVTNILKLRKRIKGHSQFLVYTRYDYL